MKQSASNPILPDGICMPDVEAHVWEDGRMYLYGSRDICGADYWCAREVHVFSSDNLIDWVDHGVAFTTDDIRWTDAPSIYSPDCAYRDGTYYFYYSMPGGKNGVAVSDKPYGPFTDVGQIQGAEGIDPAVFVDDDGTAYLYWGQNDNIRAAKLKDNMVEIDPETVTQPLRQAEHYFHEGFSLRKIGGKYYAIYTERKRHGKMATSQGYAVSDCPTHGFIYKGTVIDSFHADAETWNNHGSMGCFHGQWYVFYHRSTHGTRFSRQVCAEPLTFDENGDIAEVPMTSSGIAGTLSASLPVSGSCACELHGDARIAGDESCDLRLVLADLSHGDSAVFRYLTFSGENTLILRLRGRGTGRVELEIDGKYYSSTTIEATDTYSEFYEMIPAISGTHTVTLKCYNVYVYANTNNGERDKFVFYLADFRFEKA